MNDECVCVYILLLLLLRSWVLLTHGLSFAVGIPVGGLNTTADSCVFLMTKAGKAEVT